MKQILKISEVAPYIGFSADYIKRTLLKELNAFKITPSGNWFVRKEDLESFLAKRDANNKGAIR